MEKNQLSNEVWIPRLKWFLHALYRLLHALYPIIASITITLITAYIYSTGPFAPPGAEISYKVENYYHEKNGSYMLPVCIWNSGSKDIKNLDVSFNFESHTFGDVLDKDFKIIDMIHNASPQFAAAITNKANNANDYKEFSYPVVKKKAYFREQFYVNKPYPITVTLNTADVDLKPPITTPCDPCSC